MLFKIKHDEDIFELNPELRAIPEFDKLNSRQMQVVALVADYGSPFRSLPEKVRREKACEHSGYRFESNGRLDRNGRAVIYGEVESIEKAIKKYREIQYDEQKAMLEAIDAQIQEAIEMMAMSKNEVVKKTMKKGDTVIKEYYSPMDLAEKAMKLGARLSELKEAKEKIVGMIKSTSEPSLDITTYTSADVEVDQMNEGQSTLDLFMTKQINNGAGG